MTLFEGKPLRKWRPHWRDWGWIAYHRAKQWFVKPTCGYCTLADRPQYGEWCEICDEWESK